MGVQEVITATLFMQSAMKVSLVKSTLHFPLVRELPREVFQQIRNQNIKNNHIQEIARVKP